MNGLTEFQRDLLYVIAGLDTSYGVAIKDELEEYYKSEISPGQLYPNLDSLADKGLVEKSQYDKQMNAYELTDRGSREIEVWREWEERVRW